MPLPAAFVRGTQGSRLRRAAHEIENPSKGSRVAPGFWEIRGACFPVFARIQPPGTSRAEPGERHALNSSRSGIARHCELWIG